MRLFKQYYNVTIEPPSREGACSHVFVNLVTERNGGVSSRECLVDRYVEPEYAESYARTFIDEHKAKAARQKQADQEREARIKRFTVKA